MKMISIRQLRALLGVLALLGALATQAAAVAVEPLMTYQGRLKESGLPVTGAKNIDVLFCNCSAGVCAPACTSSSGVQSVAVSSGLFRTTFTVPSSVNLASGSWYLEVSIGGTAMSPREQLTNSPYAVVATTATGLTAPSGANGASVATNLYVTNGGIMGIGTASPTLTLSLGASTLRTIGVDDAGAVASPGNSMTVQAGAAGTLAAGGLGGALNLKAGAAGGSGNNAGGSIVLTPGDRTGIGITGAVEIAGASGGAHLKATQTTAPTFSGFGICGSAPGPTMGLVANSTDMHGGISILTGGGPTGACGATITFNRPYTAAPRAVLLTAASAGAANPGQSGNLYVSGVFTNGFQVTTANAPAVTTQLTWYYVVIE